MIRRECILTSFGLVCPLSKGDEFEAAVAEARDIIDEFNEKADHSRIDVYVLKGRIASSDEEAIRAISAEVSALIAEMESGIDKLNVTDIRAAANKARKLASGLGEDQSKLLSNAVEQARKREVKAALDRLERYLQTGSVRIQISPQGAVAFQGWRDRDRVTDVCAYRTLMLKNSWPLKQAIARAEAMSGRKVNQRAVAAGVHSHDGGQTWSAH